MSQPKSIRSVAKPSHRATIAMLAALVLTPWLAPAARASEIIPSIGITKPVNGDGAARVSGGIALRGGLLPMLESEIALGYRRETRDAGMLEVHQWPVTTSLWVKPIPSLYAGGGVGLYQTTLEYDASLGFQNETSSKFGVHLGGGLRMPLGPTASLDLNARYIFLQQQRSQLPPSEFNPDYWTTSLGIGFHF